jgi:3-phosphoshikimate 1-carboxyvinyltransferase
MGADIAILNTREESGEPVGDLRVRATQLTGTAIGPELIPKTIDELPILCVAAALADGETSITGAQELRVKETDRIHAMAVELARIGVELEEQPDGLIIQGGAILRGALCQSYGDHRVVMSLAIAGLVAKEPVVINDVNCVETSFPCFHSKLLELLTNSK